jgi:hypothetical protein
MELQALDLQHNHSTDKIQQGAAENERNREPLDRHSDPDAGKDL